MKKTLLFLSLLAATGMSAQWNEQDTNFEAPSRGIKDIHIVDANTVWAQAYDGLNTDNDISEFTRTTDGGNTWISGNIDLGDADLHVSNLVAISGTNAWVSALVPALGGGGVYNTLDGGLTWDNKNPAAYVSATSFLNVVHFFNASTGISQGDPIMINGTRKFEIYRTTDGGTTWTAITNTPNPLSEEYGLNGGNVAAGNSFWFVTDNGKLYRTTDTGLTWTKLNTPITNFGSDAASGNLFFANDNVGILIGRTPSSNTLYKTTDGGNTWSSGTPYTAGYFQINYIQGTTTLVGTNPSTTPPTVAISNDNGTTWSVIDSGTQRNSIAFINGTTGWAGGFNDGVTGLGGIFKYSGPSLGTEDFASNSKFKVYPNPTNNQLNLSGASINEVAVYDLLGKQVLTQKFSAQDQVSLNVSALQTGMYVLTATNDNGAKETVKFAKQ